MERDDGLLETQKFGSMKLIQTLCWVARVLLDKWQQVARKQPCLAAWSCWTPTVWLPSILRQLMFPWKKKNLLTERVSHFFFQWNLCWEALLLSAQQIPLLSVTSLPQVHPGIVLWGQCFLTAGRVMKLWLVHCVISHLLVVGFEITLIPAESNLSAMLCLFSHLPFFSFFLSAVLCVLPQPAAAGAAVGVGLHEELHLHHRETLRPLQPEVRAPGCFQRGQCRTLAALCLHHCCCAFLPIRTPTECLLSVVLRGNFPPALFLCFFCFQKPV